MELVIPDGAQVHITIGSPPLLALTHEKAPPVQRRLRPVLGGIVVGVLMLGSYQVGKRTASPSSDRVAQVELRGGSSLAPQELAETRLAGGDPQRLTAPILPPPNEPGRIPAEFAQQLRQARTVTPPPGQAAPAAPGANPFGLHP